MKHLNAGATRWHLVGATVVAGLALFAGNAALGLDTLYSFQLGSQNPAGGLVAGSDGNLYGTTYDGGSSGFGTAFRVTTNGLQTFSFGYSNGIQTLISFGYTNGANPEAALTPGNTNDTDLYGVTTQGGVNGLGTVFTLTDKGSLTVLDAFNGTNGSYPAGGLLAWDNGFFYGSTYYGGTTIAGKFQGFGTIFKIATNGNLTTLVSFNYTNGAYPQGALVRGKDGNLYGTTAYGGVSSNGTAFKMTPDGSLTMLVSFTFANGSAPCGGLVQWTGQDFYGTTSGGGSSSNGTVFVMATNGSLATLFSFDGANGSNPQSGLTLGNDGNLYGTTYGGGANGIGTIFKISPDGALTNIASFDYVNGANPQGVLVTNGDGNLYGTTTYGGLYGAGTVFRLTSHGELTSLYSFVPGAGFPNSGLVIGSNGCLFGTSAYGASNDSAAVFGISSSNGLSVLVPFSAPADASPNGLLLSTDGCFYGTTYGGGTNGNGTVFRVTNGIVTTLLTFTPPAGTHPLGSLLLGLDGNLYGTTSQGGPTDTGTVFKLNVASNPVVVSTVAPFIYYLYGAGAFPEGPLMQLSNSNIYGTTVEGGTENLGTLFMVTPANGVLTTLASFGGANGSNPQSGVIMGLDGNLYGTTSSGGSNGYGAVFEWTPTNGITALCSFDESNGDDPQGPLVQKADGSFYGTTQFGGGYDLGTVFCVNPVTGTLTDLATFNETNGAYPNGGLVRDAYGNLYGTTAQGGDGGAGTVFELWPVLNCVQTGNELVVSWTTNAVGFTLQFTTNLGNPVNWADTNDPSSIGSQYFVTNEIRGNQFFRLINTNQ